MKIAYVTTYDASNIEDGWSGSGYHIAQSLIGQSLLVRHVGPLRQKSSFLFSSKEMFYRRLVKKKYLSHLEPSVLKHYASQVEKILAKLDYDVVLSPGYFPIAYLRSEKPVVLWGDATFDLLKDYHPSYRNLCHDTIRNWDLIERRAHRNCDLLIYSSEWAAESAVRHYNVDAVKVKVVPFGANLNLHRDKTATDIRRSINLRQSRHCKLLFIGRDWYWKGGDLAYAVTRNLNKLGLKTQLTVVGCKPPLKESLPEFVRCIGYLDKSRPHNLSMINDLFAESHFLIHPTRAECYGIVLCEANSFGVPCLASNTGGIPTIVNNGRNGQLFTQNNVEAYCEYILYFMTNYSDYKMLAASSFAEYSSRLNWTTAGEKVKKLLEEIV